MNISPLLKNEKIKSMVGVCAAGLIALLLPPIAANIDSYIITLGCFMLLYIVAVSGLDIVFGYSGQISLGHAGFFAIGAYTTGILTKGFGVPLFFSILMGAILAALIGALLAYPASKLVFHFLSLATVAFGEITYQIITHSPGAVTGDFYGFRLGKATFFGLSTQNKIGMYYVCLAFAALFLLVKYFIVNSKVGRAFIAIRENTHAADGMGINVRKYKIVAFTISAFYTAFAGGMFILVMGYVHPDTFQQKQSVLFLTMLLFGGTGSLLGPVIGVVSVQVIIELLRSLQDYQMIIYGVLMLIVIVLIPGGLYGMCKDIFSRLSHRKARAAVDKGGSSDA